jgi:hypothetical protein|tara:strand:+ start:130 stop:498 length:369 start_codon:yes stop_codon:yes gene_type:complete
MKENYLYFAKVGVVNVDATTSCIVPASRYLGCDPASNAATDFKFQDITGSNTAIVIRLGHATGKNKEVMEKMMQLMNSTTKDNFIVVADSEKDTGSITGAANKDVEIHSHFDGLVTQCTSIT